MPDPRGRRAAAFATIGALALSSCLFNPTSKERHGTVQFLSLVLPTQAGHDGATAEVSFEIGSNLCWRLESLTARQKEGVVEIEGTSLFPENSEACAQAVAYGRAQVQLPSLPDGTWLVRAGSLVDTLHVGGLPSSYGTGRITLRAPIWVQQGHCGIAYFANLMAIVSGLPVTLPMGRAELLVRGQLNDADPCGLAGWTLPADYLVAASEVTPQ